MKSAKERMDIISAYQQLGSYRAAAELCNTTPKTVKRVVDKFEADQAGVPSPPRVERVHNYDAVTELVAERVKKSKGRMSAKRMLPIARAAGCDGSARNFRRLVAELKALWRSEHHRGRRPAVWSPGEYLVIDWAEAAPGLFLFCAVLAFSRWRFVAFATDQRASTTLALIAEAFAAIGGVPAKVLADRMACLKGGVVANVVIPTAEYVQLAGHYGFAPDFCHADDPESKGIVENLCGYSQRDLAVPLLTEAAIAGKRVDLREANTAAKAWCVEVNAAVHSEICAVPDERLLVEHELLQPLPSLRLQIGAPSVIRKVDRLSCIRYASARYSVPTRLIGSSVAVVLDHGAVCIVEPATGVIVAEHELGAPGSASVLDDHYDGPRPAPNRGPRPKTTIEQQFCALGADAEAFLIGAAAIGNTRLGSELEVLLGLGAAHGNDALIAALRRAVAFRRFRAADVRSILAAGAGTPQPRPAGDALILDLPIAPTRSLDDYKISPVVDGEVTL
ncbi:IS21 family transposase [Mycobacterium sp. CVI_P3]|uniref:IS21 family transposase n=1 Tax=Mycobacterium pinniadriaticum TaxID=2994102 RepID=A0ABT3SFH4_9MYCO|nr:IS21 family transposase [Mycobacterium pinniadriaticum]MCX2931682.1 IS21 family transposase [Mycobacterium pinniadriaticum]MCX2938243.1 IS21 family transposase [Mycobacterium pinniadriaticum]